MVSLYIWLSIYTNNEILCIIWKFDLSSHGVLGRIYALSIEVLYNCIRRFEHFIAHKWFSTFLIMYVRNFENSDGSSSYCKISGLLFSYGEKSKSPTFVIHFAQTITKRISAFSVQSVKLYIMTSQAIRQELFPLDFSTDFRDYLTCIFIWAKNSPKVQKNKYWSFLTVQIYGNGDINLMIWRRRQKGFAIVKGFQKWQRIALCNN